METFLYSHFMRCRWRPYYTHMSRSGDLTYLSHDWYFTEWGLLYSHFYPFHLHTPAISSIIQSCLVKYTTQLWWIIVLTYCHWESTQWLTLNATITSKYMTVHTSVPSVSDVNASPYHSFPLKLTISFNY